MERQNLSRNAKVRMYGMKTMCPQNLVLFLKLKEKFFRKFIYNLRLQANRKWVHTEPERAVQGSRTAGIGFPKKKTEFPWTNVRMNQSRLNKQIVAYIWQISSLYEYTKQLKEDLTKLRISENDYVGRKTYKIQNFEVLCSERR